MCAIDALLCVACGLRPCRILRFAWIHCERSVAIQSVEPRIWRTFNLLDCFVISFLAMTGVLVVSKNGLFFITGIPALLSLRA